MDLIFTPSEFVAIFNQTLEFAYPKVTIEGELSGFRTSRSKWLFFDLIDEQTSLRCFGTVYQLPGPLEDGMKLKVVAIPRLHPKFGFSMNILSITLSGEGTLRKGAQLLAAQLQKEGLFDLSRKRLPPVFPSRIGLICATASAAQADFIKIADQRWGGAEIIVVDTPVQGESAPTGIISALEFLNSSSTPIDVIVVTRGGGSTEDLAAFNDERVVRAVAASRIPTLVAVGHETDKSLAELAADVRAATPSNAAQMIFPDKAAEMNRLEAQSVLLKQRLNTYYQDRLNQLKSAGVELRESLINKVAKETARLESIKRLVAGLDPDTVLRRGYALVRLEGQLVRSVQGLKRGQVIEAQLSDGKINSIIKGVTKNA